MPVAQGAGEHDTGIRRAWKNASLRRIVSSFGAVNLAETAFVTALAIHAYSESGTLALGLVGARFLPSAAAGIFLGPSMDRRLGRRPLAAVAAARTAVLACAAACVVVGAPLAVAIVLIAVDAVV